MKIDYHLYQLNNSKTEGGGRKGFLVRLFFDKDLCGYADVHPWPELGDLNISAQLSLLSEFSKGLRTEFELPNLLKNSLAFARIDAKARSRKQNLFQESSPIYCHFLVENLKNFNISKAQSLQFSSVKIKIPKDFNHELPFLKGILEDIKKEKMRVRLDFNEKLTLEEFQDFMEHIAPFHNLIEFLEDPFPYNPELWEKFQDFFQIPFACDRNSTNALEYPRSSDVLVFKPALHSNKSFLEAELGIRKVVVTSYLAHPLEQAASFYMAGQLFKKDPKCILYCGLFSHLVYELNPFSACFPSRGPSFSFLGDYGMGFTRIFEKLQWITLS